MTEDCAAATAAAAAVNVMELEPAGTVTDWGIVRDELLEVRLAAAPPAGARPVKIRVHVVDPAGARLDGTHAREFGTRAGGGAAGGVRVTVALREAAAKAAVTAALVLAETLEALAVNAPEVDPEAITSDEGTVRLLLLLAIASVTPPLGAAPLRVAVQLDVPGVVMEEGLQAREESTGIEPTVSVLPVAVEAKDLPPDEAAIGFATPTLILPREIEGLMDTVATTPSAIAEVLTPEAKHW